jgi:hypothetical protein
MVPRPLTAERLSGAGFRFRFRFGFGFAESESESGVSVSSTPGWSLTLLKYDTDAPNQCGLDHRGAVAVIYATSERERGRWWQANVLSAHQNVNSAGTRSPISASH